VCGDIDELNTCDVVLADFSEPDEGTSMECWVASMEFGLPVYAFNFGARISPWLVFIAESISFSCQEAIKQIEPA
jgi:nucleoside 2-deoxyribosyltransferase